MVLVHHVITHMQICKASDTLSLVALILFLFFLLRTEDITLRDNCKREERILIAAAHLAVEHHNLALLQGMSVILRIKAGHTLVCNILRQTLCPGTGA